MHQPLLHVRAFTGETRPLVSSQSQNQLPQSSVVSHATDVAPLGLLGLDGVLVSVGSDSSVGEEERSDAERPPPPEDEEEEVLGVVSGPPEHATRRATAENRIEKGFMAARPCNREATHECLDFQASWRNARPALAPPWRYMLIGSGMNRAMNITRVKTAMALRFPSRGSAPVDG